MEEIEEYINKTVVAFNGTHFFESCYNGKSYISIIKEKTAILFSEQRITKTSQQYNYGYKTELSKQSLDDILESKMYIIYKGNRYEVQTVSPRLKELELLARKGHEAEDKAIGFTGKNPHLVITRKEIENIQVEKRSIYKETMEKSKHIK